MWTQIVGKIRMAYAPPVNHWWHVTLYPSARGLTTSAVPYRNGSFDIEFDFLADELVVRTSDGRSRTVALAKYTSRSGSCDTSSQTTRPSAARRTPPAPSR